MKGFWILFLIVVFCCCKPKSDEQQAKDDAKLAKEVAKMQADRIEWEEGWQKAKKKIEMDAQIERLTRR